MYVTSAKDSLFTSTEHTVETYVPAVQIAKNSHGLRRDKTYNRKMFYRSEGEWFGGE